MPTFNFDDIRPKGEPISRYQIGHGSLALGEAVFDRYGRPLGFVRYWDRKLDLPEIYCFSADAYEYRYPNLVTTTLTLTDYCEPGKEVKYNVDCEIDLYEEDNTIATIPISQFGRYAFGLDKLADGLSKAVALGAMTEEEASKEFRQFVVSIQKDEEKAKLIARLEERLAELQAEAD